MNINTKQTILFSFSTFLVSLVMAEPLVTDRPDVTESSSVIAPGFAQLETGITAIEDVDDEFGTEYGNTLLRLGLVENWELRLGWGGYLDSSAVSGSSDGSLGFKYYINPEGDALLEPEVAIIAQTTLPTGESAITSDRLDPAFLMLFSHTLTDKLALSYNLGSQFATSKKGDGSRTTLSSALYSVSLGYSANEKLGFFVELFGEIGLSAEDSPISVDCGLTWLLNDDSQLDFFTGAGLNNEADEFFVGLGYSLRLGI